MSKIADLAYDIEALYIDGLSAAKIAQELNCPVEMVTAWIKDIGVAEMPQDPWEAIEDPHIVG
jgi:orotate phosphoribosyltransferase-like protein